MGAGPGGGRQQFHFDEEGRLLEHRTFLRDQELARDRYVWTARKLTIEGAVGHVEITLGAFGEALSIREGRATSKLVWEGTFGRAPGSANLEGIYALSAGGGSRHLPQDTTARGIHQRMGTFRFTGKVSVDDALGQTVVATYDEGRVVRWETKRSRGEVRWTQDGAPERESAIAIDAPSGEGGSELVWDRRGGRTLGTHYRAAGMIRDVALTWGNDGQLARVDSTVSDGREVSTSSVLLGPCDAEAPTGPPR